VLTVVADSASSADQLERLESQIISRINGLVGAGAVTSLMVIGQSLPREPL
jgi:hypothetical protein